MANSDILNFTEENIVDEDIERFEFHEYKPVNKNLDTFGEIRINIEQQDLFTLPSEAYILVEGRLLKADGTSYTDTDAITLVNNGIMYLFSQISYQLSNQDVENIYQPGQSTTMLGYLKYPVEFQLGEGMNQLWQRDTADSTDPAVNTGFRNRQDYIIKQSTDKGTFSFCIPLNHIFGFADDYNKVLYGFKHTLTLVRKADNDAIIKASGVTAGKVNLTQLSLFMPHVTPSVAASNTLYKVIESKVDVPFSFRSRQCDTIAVPISNTFSWRLSARSSSERPRYVIVVFQTSKDGDQEKNPSVFNHCNLKNMYVTLNSERYPSVDYDLDFNNNKYSRAFKDAAKLDNRLYGVSDIIAQPNLTALNYKYICPLFVFDVSKQAEWLKSTVLDVQIKATFGSNVPAGTIAYAVVFSDKLLRIKSDGSRMNVVY